MCRGGWRDTGSHQRNKYSAIDCNIYRDASTHPGRKRPPGKPRLIPDGGMTEWESDRMNGDKEEREKSSWDEERMAG